MEDIQKCGLETLFILLILTSESMAVMLEMRVGIIEYFAQKGRKEELESLVVQKDITIGFILLKSIIQCLRITEKRVSHTLKAGTRE